MSLTQDGFSITQLLDKARSGDAAAWGHAFEMVYQELKRTAQRLIRSNAQATLSPTALVHECYLRLLDLGGQDVENRAHFHALAARAMRFVLINRARDRCSQKRGAGAAHVALSELLNSADTALCAEDREAHEFIALDQALLQLEKENPDYVRALECRIFAGLTDSESAAALDFAMRLKATHSAPLKSPCARAVRCSNPMARCACAITAAAEPAMYAR